MKHLLDYTRYNLWANTGMTNLFRTVDDALVEQAIVSSFPSIRATLLHLWGVEEIWLERLKGNSPKGFPLTGFSGPNSELYDGLTEASTRFMRFVEAQDEAYFSTTLEFSLLTAPGVQRELPATMIYHCMNHQTSHRGQLITMGRQVGITSFPRTDYIIWAREQNAGG
jgi:uncharacterized damage-inducible protein DinB